ncbi:hypothetical protein WMY93_005835 [Mugilogobius chulae]|uniref:Uncharacterized protein n=1 Tax=Mugilogobius chulae TaxID=88201 RepID=A0AAW0PJ00_9GOBI
MTCGALTKLGFLVILAFIICLPDFFIINRVLHVSLRCVRPLLWGDVEIREQTGDKWSSSTCGEHWEQVRAAADQRNMTQVDRSCFVCQADVNMAGLHHNSSPAESISFEVSLTLVQNNALSNITLLGHYNRSSQYLNFSKDEEEVDQERKNHEPGDSFLYCPPSVNTANHSCCLLWLSVQIFARKGLPWKHTGTKDEWGSVIWVLWLSLLGVGLMLILITVTQQIIEGRRRSSDKAKIYTLSYAAQGNNFIGMLICPPILRIATKLFSLTILLSLKTLYNLYIVSKSLYSSLNYLNLYCRKQKAPRCQLLPRCVF